MLKLIDTVTGLHNSFFEKIEEAQENWFLGLSARLVFSSVLLLFFWQSAITKIGDDLFSPSVGAYAQILPKTLEAVEYDIEQISAFHSLIVILGTYAEFVLPALILVGLFTRLASIGMIAMIAVMSIVDIFGHEIDAKTIGSLFDRFQDGVIADQRLLWIFPLLYLVTKGAGMISADRIFLKLR
jgi:putative oxidoreductase